MNGTDPDDAPLLAAFRAFYGELSRLRRHVEADPWAAAGGGDARPDAPRAAAQRLAAVLERQALQAARAGGVTGAGLYHDAQYVMAALADEVMLHLDWWGREGWRVHLLEARFFGSGVAGERVFDRIEELLRERDAGRRDLAAVYLMALSLGFQGRFRGTDRLHRVEELRQELFAFVFRRHPSVARGERQLFPQAYENTLRDRAPLPPRRVIRWTGVLAAVVLVYLVASTAVWRRATGPVAAEADAIVRTVHDGGAP